MRWSLRPVSAQPAAGLARRPPSAPPPLTSGQQQQRRQHHRQRRVMSAPPGRPRSGPPKPKRGGSAKTAQARRASHSAPAGRPSASDRPGTNTAGARRTVRSAPPGGSPTRKHFSAARAKSDPAGLAVAATTVKVCIDALGRQRVKELRRRPTSAPTERPLDLDDLARALQKGLPP